MNTATVVYVVLGGLAASTVLSLAMGRLLRRLRLDREATGERPETTVVNVRDLDAESLERIWEQIASQARPPRQRSPLICGPASPCDAHDPETCSTTAPCCPTCPYIKPETA